MHMCIQCRLLFPKLPASLFECSAVIFFYFLKAGDTFEGKWRMGNLTASLSRTLHRELNLPVVDFPALMSADKMAARDARGISASNPNALAGCMLHQIAPD
ncbi:hypothetical protein CEXT_745661 [Caerostris extrusa]|uniref:Uncharacterized protein n=1 Tax=Caerostris extrusa TaxID=172846 RepID=A0AAV4NT15_CAEEX|nr:hypothetical protein CEXT_745661 [Caerostris extrusa]